MSADKELLPESSGKPTREQILESLRQVIDPELGVNIVDLGLVYGVEIQNSHVRVRMTMTSPACPLYEYLSEMVHTAIECSVPNVRSVEVMLVWDPPWSPERMSEEARRRLGWSK
jgi:metal-sulfur cluster biosynthetic enzyme